MPGLHKKPKGYVSDAQRKAVHASKKDGGKGNPNKPKMISKKTTPPPTPGGHKTRRIKKDKSRDRQKLGVNYITNSGRKITTKGGPATDRKKIKAKNKPMAKFPDLSGDGKVTKKDILMGRGVIDKPKMLRKKRKNYA
jgi:hypothetical protein